MTPHYSHWFFRILPSGVDGITFGNHVFFRHEKPSSGLIAHEAKHVEQYKDLGIPRFLAAYTLDYLACRALGMRHREAYKNIRLEMEAGPT